MTDLAKHSAGNHRWTLPKGRLLRRVLRNDPSQEYLLYIPTTGAESAPVMVSVHGISRNAHEQARVFSPYCERFGVVLVVPRFTSDAHRDYQRLGRSGRGGRADLALQDYLAEVAKLTGADVSQIYLFGFSGGAQFAHRYVLAHPHRVAHAIVAAAGWYTFPDHKQRYPYGIRSNRKLAGVQLNPEEFLHVPVEVLVGNHDVGTSNLRATERTIKQQGENRKERAKRWVAAMQEAALNYNIEPIINLTIVDKVDHSFSKFCQNGALVRRVFKSFFDVAIEPDTGKTEEKLNGNGSKSIVDSSKLQLM